MTWTVFTRTPVASAHRFSRIGSTLPEALSATKASARMDVGHSTEVVQAAAGGGSGSTTP